MRALPIAVLALLSLGACDGGDEVEYPDITGRYQFVLGGTTGCDGDASLLDDWASGPLAIEGEPLALDYDFGEVNLIGSVGTEASFQFAGTFELDGTTLAVGGGGNAIVDGPGWSLQGSISAEVDDDEVESNNCNIEGPFEGVWIGS